MYTTVRQRPGFYHDEFVRYYTSPCKVFYVGRVESGLSSFAFIFSVGSSVCRAHGRVVAHYDISQGPPASGVSDPLIGRTPTRRPYIRTPLTLLVYFSARPRGAWFLPERTLIFSRFLRFWAYFLLFFGHLYGCGVVSELIPLYLIPYVFEYTSGPRLFSIRVCIRPGRNFPQR